MKNKAYYDLHIHSCLSPCGSDDMTPLNIAGMAMLKGLSIVALSDHNTTNNCPAFFTACQEYGITPIAGAEVTTSEDIHVLTLFESLEAGMAFGDLLNSKRVLIENSPNIFGNQIIMDFEDNIVGEEKYLLINSVDISIDDIQKIANSYSGIAIPAHIDKNSNSLTSVFGTIPESDFTAYEFKDLNTVYDYVNQFYALKGKRFVSNSDAHYLWDINEKVNSIDLFSDPFDYKEVVKEFFAFLKGDNL